MVRNYKPVAGSRRERSYTDEDLQNALGLINEGQPLKRVAAMFNIPRRTLRNHVSGERKTTVVGRKKALLPEKKKVEQNMLPSLAILAIPLMLMNCVFL